jgi:uncharacterized protein involved in tolerance to divalent cations
MVTKMYRVRFASKLALDMALNEARLWNQKDKIESIDEQALSFKTKSKDVLDVVTEIIKKDRYSIDKVIHEGLTK